MVGEQQPVGQPGEGILQRLGADCTLGRVSGGRPGKHVRDRGDERDVLVGETSCRGPSDAEDADRALLAGDGHLDNRDGVRPRPQVGDVEALLEGHVLADDRLLRDEREARGRRRRVRREQLVARDVLPAVAREGEELRVGQRLEDVHRVDVKMFAQHLDRVLDEVGEVEPDECPPSEVGERRLAGGIHHPGRTPALEVDAPVVTHAPLVASASVVRVARVAGSPGQAPVAP